MGVQPFFFALLLGGIGGIGAVVLELDAGALRKELERAGKIQPLKLLNERKNIPLRPAAKAVERPPIRRNIKRRRLFVVKRDILP